jgi:hypothetical protein
MVSRKTAFSRVAAISEGASDSLRAGRAPGRSSSEVFQRRTPMTTSRSAPRWMAGESGAVMRTLPSPYQAPLMRIGGKKMGMAADAMTWSIRIVSRTPTRVARTQGRASGLPSKKVTAEAVA